MEFPKIIECNNLCYCEEHLRDICHECCVDFACGIGAFEFQIPENGQPQYPVAVDTEDLEATLLAKRWLDMQRETFPAATKPVQSSHVQLPILKLSDEAKNSAVGLQETLLGVLHQLLPMCTTQRYFFANQPSIMMQDFETFQQSMLLYGENLHDGLDRKVSFLSLNSNRVCDISSELKRKAQASLVSAFGLLLELNTQRTFWRMMELTAESYIRLLESYDQEADDDVVLTEKAKTELLQWIGHVFWSLKHAQHVLNELRKLQHIMYQRKYYPFYPWDLDALKDDLDVHLIIAKLSRGPVHDFHFMASAFDALRQASDKHPKQMVHVNCAMMVAIDEMSARFRVLELLTRAGQVIATGAEVKKALYHFKFDPNGVELYSSMEEALTILSEVDNSEYQNPTPKLCSFLQGLLVMERDCRIKHKQKLLRLPVQDTMDFSKEMFDVFKPTYSKLYRDSIRHVWKGQERSLLSSEVASRTQHRRAVQRKKGKNGKKKSSGPVSNWEVSDLAEARSVPSFVDPSLFWAVGDGSVERYKPPILREKVKTQKSSIAGASTDESCLSPSSSSRTASPVDEEVASPRPRSLDQLKESDLTTRDILWRKVKGLVRWNSVVQFLARLGCSVISLDGSKKKVVDEHTGRCSVLHRPHPSEECRRDQLDNYRMQLEDWLLINYDDLVTPEEMNSPTRRIRDMSLDSSKNLKKDRL